MNAATDPRFWNQAAPAYAKKPVPDEAAYRATLARVEAHLRPSMRALELGCGTGSTAIALAPRVKELVATDYSEAMIAIAKTKARHLDNVQLVARSLEDVEGTFDVVMAFNLLHLVDDVPGAIRRIHALVAPGGLFISKTPCVGEGSIVLRGLIPVMRAFGRAPFVSFVKKAELERTIAGAGFEILETGLYPAKSHSLFVVGRRS
jgi:SAM-dependent methyltransferase